MLAAVDADAVLAERTQAASTGDRRGHQAASLGLACSRRRKARKDSSSPRSRDAHSGQEVDQPRHEWPQTGSWQYWSGGTRRRMPLAALGSRASFQRQHAPLMFAFAWHSATGSAQSGQIVPSSRPSLPRAADRWSGFGVIDLILFQPEAALALALEHIRAIQRIVEVRPHRERNIVAIQIRVRCKL